MDIHHMGIDIGSTTAKVVVLDHEHNIRFSAYRRHNTETLVTLNSLLAETLENLGDVKVELLITGSAGMGISEKFDLPFIQEVVASAEFVRKLHPEVKTLVDISISGVKTPR